MSKIRNWSRIDPRQGFRKCWRNEETGEKVGVTQKVPGDGYYLKAYEPDEDMEPGEGEQFESDTVKRDIYKKATQVLETNTGGLLDFDEPTFQGKEIFNDGLRLVGSTPDGETLHIIPENPNGRKGWSLCGLDGEVEDIEFDYIRPDDEAVCYNCKREVA